MNVPDLRPEYLVPMPRPIREVLTAFSMCAPTLENNVAVFRRTGEVDDIGVLIYRHV
jgi:hypothetical protein